MDTQTGTKLRVKTVDGQSLEGHLFSYDKESKIIVLQTPAATARRTQYDFHIIKTSFIKEVDAIESGNESHLVGIRAVDISRLEKLEAMAVAAEQQRMARKAVSEDAQVIPDHCSYIYRKYLMH
jgi:hypothetical protein